jgi:hypothetical protein
MVRKPLGLSAILAVFWLSLPIFCPASSVDRYLHKNAQIDSAPQDLFHGSAMKPILPLQAASFALHRLEARGVRDIVICEISWIAAAVSGYLVDVKGKATINGINYSTFRIGIRDGSEKKNGKSLAGDEFVFIARGEKESGRPVWYPSPGPDYKLADGGDVTEGMLAYEFLLNRKKFESLRSRFP